jgi:raffinose/stachyose/melibiose transport system permease protein
MRRNATIFSIAFLAPAFLLYTMFIIYPMINSAYYSLTEWNGGKDPVFIGLENFTTLVTDDDYWLVLRNTLTLVALTVLFQISLGITFAYLIYLTTRGSGLFRSIYYLPVVVAPIAIGLMFFLFYNGDIGPINKFLESVGLESWRHNWLSDRDIVLYSVIAPQVWQYIGLFVVIFLAGMKSIPREILESARVDGASSFRILFAIVIPMLTEIIVICVILAVTGSLKSFDHSWIITRGGPGNASSFIATLMYKKAFMEGNFGYGSAITITIMVYAVAFTVLFRRLVLRQNIEY